MPLGRDLRVFARYRSNAGVTGTAGKLVLMLPTQSGTFILNNLKRLDRPTVSGVDWGAMSLADYHVLERDCTIGGCTTAAPGHACLVRPNLRGGALCMRRLPRPGLLRTTRVHDRLTPRMIAAFFHTNFSLTKPRTTEVLHTGTTCVLLCRTAIANPPTSCSPQMQHFLDNLPDCLPGDDEMQVRAALAAALWAARRACDG